LAAFAVLFVGFAPPAARTETAHEVFLKGTGNDLDVFHIRGRRPGPTLLIIGGIQGDEPGGYLAADLYADIALAEGNLIVAPRANFSSILQNRRGIQGDMNRKFASRPGAPDPDVRVVEIIKGLMTRSDFFLNLHDGSGFFSPSWVSEERNPRRYGQSIIVDSETYVRPDGTVIDLGAVARRVIDKINRQVTDPEHQFTFNNHRTSEPDTPHREQRLSATYHALTRAGIPAFGIETSKSIRDYRQRVRYQTIAINAFMEEFGIRLEVPRLDLDAPALKYMVVSINGRPPLAVSKDDALRVRRGDRLRILHIESNYTRGVVARVKGGSGKPIALNTDVPVTANMAIEALKDRFLMAVIPVEIIREDATESAGIRRKPAVEHFCLRINDRTFMIEPGEEIRIIRGDRLVALDPKTNLGADQERRMKIDLRGFQSPGRPDDDRGRVIDTERDLQLQYGLPRGDALVFPLEAKLDQKVFGRCFLAMTEPKFEYLVIRRAHGADFVARHGDILALPRAEVLRIMDIRTNLPDTVPLGLAMAGRTLEWRRDGAAGIDGARLSKGESPLDITREGRRIGTVWFKPGDEFSISSADDSSVLPVRYSKPREDESLRRRAVPAAK
jgi:predicted deacylase